MESISDKAQWRQRAAGIMAFKYLSPSELDSLLKAASILRYSPGEAVVREGELDAYLYGILSGTVSVTVRDSSKSDEGKDVYMCSLGPGDAFGEAGLFMSVKRTATVSATDDTVLLRIHRSDLSAFFKSQPSGGNKLLLVVVYGLLRKLRAANQELAYERKADLDQDDVDALLSDLLGQ
ncbi:MAG TPA: cyclic nucleotide-binding domain-containing protein [Spirochaetales bacterium]|nr:cyclic nucleotide-binding domain-containing protein [Spirochaetales bacterium]MBP7264713.1 cyclic nucleotide-binding domain-containing protein [Spirochaetia bacterium]HPE37287.1 cyclic nucleotide-binding domain-containing protein [Spirochaetales bacterium]